MEVASLNPAALESTSLESVFNHLVGIHDNAVGVGDVVAKQDACHALARAVLDAKSRVDDKLAFVLETLQFENGTVLTAHVHDDILLDFVVVELLLAIGVDNASSLAQLFGNRVEDCCVVSYVIG